MVSTEPGQGFWTAPQLSEMFLSLLEWLLKPFLCAPLHSLSFLPLQDRPDCWCAAERAHASHAGHLHKGRSCGQARNQECVPVSRLQDPPEGTHVRVDLQPEDQREPGQVDISRSGLAAADLTGNQMLFHWGVCGVNREVPFRAPWNMASEAERMISD